MYATWSNVKNGMAGSYAIYDPIVEKNLSSQKYDVVIPAPTSYADPYHNMSSKEPKHTDKHKHKLKHMHTHPHESHKLIEVISFYRLNNPL
jgi:hypothetical protein